MKQSDSPSPVNTRQLRVLGIPGSLRSGSYNRRLLEAAVIASQPDVKIEVVYGIAAIPLFDEDVEQQTNGGPSSVKQLRARVGAADGLLISTPEYNQSMSGVLKNTIDWLSRPGPEEVLIGKPIGIMGASGGRWGTRLAQANLRQVLTATESLVMPQPAIFIAEASRIFDQQGTITDDITRRMLEKYLSAFGRWLKLVGAPSLTKAQ